MGTGNVRADRNLLSAVKKGMAEQVEALLSAGANPDGRDCYDLTLLMWASRKGHVEVIGALARHGADLEARDRVGRVALHHAVLLQRLISVRALIAAGADLEAKESFGNTAMDLAQHLADYGIAHELAKAGAQGEVPDPGDLSFGVIRSACAETTFDKALKRLWDRIDEHKNPNPWRERGHLNVVFQVNGPILPVVWSGVRSGTFSRENRILTVQVAVPDPNVDDRAAVRLILGALREAVDIAIDRFGRTGICFASDQVRALLLILGR